MMNFIKRLVINLCACALGVIAFGCIFALIYLLVTLIQWSPWALVPMILLSIGIYTTLEDD